MDNLAGRGGQAEAYTPHFCQVSAPWQATCLLQIISCR